MRRSPDPVRLEVFHQLMAALCEEGGNLLRRSAHSPNIRERQDFSFALFDGDARLVAQAAHIPVHLGSAGESVRAVIANLDLGRGDAAILNDPFAGGTHLPDVTMVLPVFLDAARAPTFFLVNRAHHADIGGAVPGSMGIARDLIAEGLVLPPCHYARAGRVNEELLRLIRANVRGAGERMLDLRAQYSSLQRGEQRLREVVANFGRRQTESYSAYLMDHVEKLAAQAIRRLTAGSYEAAEVMESDGALGGPFRIRLRLNVGRRLGFDFRATDDAAAGGINANRGVVTAACVYALACLCADEVPANEGLFRLLDIQTRPGSLVEPPPGSAVVGGNVETSQRLVDVCLSAMARAGLRQIPAQSAGTMTNVTIGGHDFSLYETLPGGSGAGPNRPGAAAIQTHMTNTRNTPIEDLEHRYPIRILTYTVRRGSGGAGKRAGGDGLIKEIEFLAASSVSLFAERHETAPAGAQGGKDGAPGAFALRRSADKRSRRIASKTTLQVEPGDVLSIQTPGGGGYGATR